jgi:DNA-binding response OmpR family regulator
MNAARATAGVGHNPILVVDDDSAIRAAIAEALRDEGYEVREAADGQVALDYLRTAGERPCLILLDLWMPNVDGAAFRQSQVGDDAWSSIPVVILTAASDAAARARSLGAVSWMRKPLRLANLMAVVAAHC